MSDHDFSPPSCVSSPNTHLRSAELHSSFNAPVALFIDVGVLPSAELKAYTRSIALLVQKCLSLSPPTESSAATASASASASRVNVLVAEDSGRFELTAPLTPRCTLLAMSDLQAGQLVDRLENPRSTYSGSSTDTHRERRPDLDPLSMLAAFLATPGSQGMEYITVHCSGDSGIQIPAQLDADDLTQLAAHCRSVPVQEWTAFTEGRVGQAEVLAALNDYRELDQNGTYARVDLQGLVDLASLHKALEDARKPGEDQMQITGQGEDFGRGSVEERAGESSIDDIIAALRDF